MKGSSLVQPASVLTIIVAHDYQCPWSWVSFIQALRLRKEFPQITLDWRGYELLPDGLGPRPEKRPQPSGRFTALAREEGVNLPTWPEIVSTHAALEGAEYAKDRMPACFERYNEAVYRAFWEQSKDISDLRVLGTIAEGAGLAREEFLDAVAERRYGGRIVPFNDPAHADGVTHVTTFRFRGEQCAEAPYSTIRGMAERLLAHY